MACDKHKRPGDLAYGHVAGTICHDETCLRQAIILTNREVTSGSPGAWYPALVFDIPTGKRVIDSSSRIDVVNAAGWHIAEHYTLGMDIPMPPPVLRKVECLYKSEELGYDEICPCGCGRQYYKCDCDSYCDGECEETVRHNGEVCSSCEDHGECGCDCNCYIVVSCSGDPCYDCQTTPLCEDCRDTHTVGGAARCSDCQNAYDDKATTTE
jgi:hypothetical protein